MEEEGGEEDTQQGERENADKRIADINIIPFVIFEVRPDSPDHQAKRADCHIEPSKLPTKYYPGVSITETGFTEGKEGKRGEDNEGGLSVEDLERGFTVEVESGEN